MRDSEIAELLANKGLKFGQHVQYTSDGTVKTGTIFPHPTEIGLFTEESTPTDFSYCRTNHTNYNGAHYREKGISFDNDRHIKGRHGKTPRAWSGKVLSEDDFLSILPIVPSREEIKFFNTRSGDEQKLATLSTSQKEALKPILGLDVCVNYIGYQIIYKHICFESPADLQYLFINPSESSPPILFSVHRSHIHLPKSWEFQEIYAWIPNRVGKDLLRKTDVCRDWSDALLGELLSFLPPDKPMIFKEFHTKKKNKCYTSLTIPPCYQRVLLYETWNREFSLRKSDYKKSPGFTKATTHNQFSLQQKFYNLNVLAKRWNIEAHTVQNLVKQLLVDIDRKGRASRDLEAVLASLGVVYDSGEEWEVKEKRSRKRSRKPSKTQTKKEG